MVESNSIAKFAVLAVGLMLAIVLGNLVVTDQTSALLWVAGGSLLTFCLWLGKDIWLLIPFSLLLNLRFPWLPGGFPPGQIAILLAFGWFLVLFAMRKVRLRLRMTAVEVAAIVLLLSILQVWMRNPVGLSALGSESIGARPYFNVAMAVIGALMLGSVIVTPEKVRAAMRWMIAGGLLSVTINLIPFLIPSAAQITGRLFGAVGHYRQFAGMETGPVDSGSATRILPATELGILMSRWIASRMNPVMRLFHPFWGLMILSSMAVAGLGGFRSGLFTVFLNLGLGAYYWGRGRAVVLGAFLGITALVMISLVNLMAPLPPNIQRSLSFLPGTWEERIRADAKNSTDWRVELWKEALTTDRYIHNKILGDGLGFSARELAAQKMMEDMKIRGGSGFDLHREHVLITGDYHSGPVQTIRTTGYVGLLILLVAMSVIAVRAHRLILRARGTPYFPVVCFFAIPMVWHPAFFVLIFGAFGTDVPLLFMNMGLLRLMENNLLPALATNTQPVETPAPVVPRMHGPRSLAAARS
jgi:hypothetical protein